MAPACSVVCSVTFSCRLPLATVALNMKELGKDNIEQLAKKGKEAWNQVLGKIEVEGGNLDQYRTFYSCLYRSLLFPRKFYELDSAGQPVQ